MLIVSLVMKFHHPLFQHQCNAWLALIKAMKRGFLDYRMITLLLSTAVLEMPNALQFNLWEVHKTLYIKYQSIGQLNFRANFTSNASECVFTIANAGYYLNQ